MAEEEKKTEGPTPPDGVLPFFFPDSGAIKYEMKTGEGIVDLVSESVNQCVWGGRGRVLVGELGS